MTQPDEPITCLLVDDLDENLIALEAVLRSTGVVCLKARSGEAALELLLVHDVALALLDVQMPGMNGFELAEFMRGSERSRHVPIIFVTAGSADQQRRFQGYEAGAVDFINKPIEPDVLRSKASVFFDLFRQKRQITAQRYELESLAAALRAADQRKNEFLAVLGHELRNPIMALGAGLRLIERRGDAETAAMVHAEMGRAITHIARLVEDLLDITRIDQGKILLRPERIKLQDVLSFAVEKTRHAFEKSEHRLELAIPSEPIWLDADGVRVTQIVSNLLLNAAKYTPPGGDIRLALQRDNDAVEIEVSDTGVGIPPEMQAQIFEIFAQVDDGSGRMKDGLGIGLALVKQLVELHGGTIALKASEPGQGSTFAVTLPAGAQ